MSRSSNSNAIGLVVLGGLGLLAFTFTQSELAPTQGEQPPDGLSAHERDVLALARMLASETRDARTRVIIGWITVNAARTWHMTVFRLLTGKSGMFGPQKYFYPDGSREIRYASTAEQPTAATLQLARGLLDGSIKPPQYVEHTKPSAYVELTPASKKLGPDGKPLQPEYTATKILAKQQTYGGIVGRINNWFLYAKGAKPISSVEQATAV